MRHERQRLSPSQPTKQARCSSSSIATAPAEVIRKQLDRKWRNHLNRSEKNGLLLEVADSREAYREFVELYKAMRERKPFKTSVDVGEFTRIQELLPDPARMQIFLAKRDGESNAALVGSLMGDSAIYLLGATNEKGRELKASYFLQWQAMLWLKQHGARWYDLGGIDREANPGGYDFKSRFGGRERTGIALHICQGCLLSAGVEVLAALRRRGRSAGAQRFLVTGAG
jgi:lipid II:glycine glycyltransferase (peptidoglycan interpeptide bridge formation enzyme)